MEAHTLTSISYSLVLLKNIVYLIVPLGRRESCLLA